MFIEQVEPLGTQFYPLKSFSLQSFHPVISLNLYVHHFEPSAKSKGLIRSALNPDHKRYKVDGEKKEKKKCMVHLNDLWVLPWTLIRKHATSFISTSASASQKIWQLTDVEPQHEYIPSMYIYIYVYLKKKRSNTRKMLQHHEKEENFK